MDAIADQIKNETSQSNLIKLLNSISIPKLSKLIDFVSDAYFNETPLIEDWQFDVLIDNMLERNPKYKRKVGAKIRTAVKKTALPVWLGSLDKLKGGEFDKLDRWIRKNKATEWIISEKLDGVSCLLNVDKHNTITLYTRGDGSVGTDITHIYPHLRDIQMEIPPILVRGELIIEKKVFKIKYATAYSNPLSMVVGLLSGKSEKEGLKDLRFIAYEIIDLDSETQPPPETQYNKLETIGFKVASNIVVKKLTMESLSSALSKFKAKSAFNIDGIVIQTNLRYKRNTTGNPSYAFAFKINDPDIMKETTVIEVEWNVSKHGKLKPRIKFEMVEIKGKHIQYTTGFNAKYIVDNKIGPGAVIRIVRSGDVIPYIDAIIQQASEPSLPDGNWVWTDSKVDIKLVEQSEKMCMKLAVSFFHKLGIQYVGLSTVRRLFGAGFNTILKIIEASPQDLVDKVERIEYDSANRIYNNIRNGLERASIPIVIAASNCFGVGIGTDKVKALFKMYPNILIEYKTMDDETRINAFNKIPSFSRITSEKIAWNLELADEIIQALKPYINISSGDSSTKKTKADEGKILSGKKIAITGGGERELKPLIELLGGEVVKTVNKTTSVLIAKTVDGEQSNKIKLAVKYNVPIVLYDDFLTEIKMKVANLPSS
jgi:NAD-dependent DNA ligase